MATELEDWLNSLDDKDGTIALLSKVSFSYFDTTNYMLMRYGYEGKYYGRDEQATRVC